MKKIPTESQMLQRIIIHSIDKTIWDCGIELTNSNWIRFVEIFDVIALMDGWII